MTPGGLVFPRHRLALASVIAISLALGWHLRWLLDDAYISFRYAWNLAHGHGLTFNPGETPPVEGYTNFLWTLLMAVPIGLGLDPTYPAIYLDLACGAGALWATWFLARGALGEPGHALASVLLVGFNYTFLCFLTSGLETGLQSCLLTAALGLAARLPSWGWPAAALAALSVCGAAALLTRLDSAVVGVVILGWVVLDLCRAPTAPRAVLRRVAWLVVPGSLIVATWLAWKLLYYGSCVPNTWYARNFGMDPALRWSRGLKYIVGFVGDYWLWPFLLAALASFRSWRRSVHVALMVSVIAWCAYVVHVGADYMEYRFMVPILPAVIVFLVAAARDLHRRAVPALVLALLVASLVHGWANAGTPIGHGRLGPILLRKGDPADNPWSNLREFVAGIPGTEGVPWVFPALGRAGYYTRFRIVDLHGLADPWVARHGLVRDEAPGHDKYAPLSYLRARGVALADSFGQPCYWYAFFGEEELEGESLVRIGGWLFWYVTPHPAIDTLITLHGHGQQLPFPSRSACREATRREPS